MTPQQHLGGKKARSARGGPGAAVQESLEARLLLAASISGDVYQTNGAGGGVAGVTVFMDTNRNGLLDVGERSVVTDAGGHYEFANTPPGKYNIAALVKDARYWTAETFDRLIGLGSWQDTGWVSPLRERQTDDDYAALWEIDPQTGFAFNSFPIVGDGNADPDDVNFAGLTAIPGRPGWYLAQTQDQGSASWNCFFDCEVHLVTIHWEPGMAYAEASVFANPGHDLTYGGGLDFDPTGDPNVVYGGLGDDYVWPWNIEYNNEWLWKTDLRTGLYRYMGLGTEDIGNVFLPGWTLGWQVGDLQFDQYGNLWLFFSEHLYRLDKTNGDTLETIYMDVHDWAAEWNPQRANFWTAKTGLGTLNPATQEVTTIRSAFDFSNIPPRPDPPGGAYLIEGLEYVASGFTDKPVELGAGNVTGINFGHVYHAVGISGQVFRDTNGNGLRDAGESEGLLGRRVFLDTNANNRYDLGETFCWTDSQGRYEFANQPPGSYRIALESVWGPDDATWGGNIRPGLDGVDLQAGDYYRVDFGIGRSGDVRGWAFNDLNVNGRHDAALTLPVQGMVYPDVAIPDGAGISCPIEIDSPGAAVEDVNVYLAITHPSVGDLRVELVSPAGTRVRLFQHVGGDADDFDGTFLDDEAAASITTVTPADAPFMAAYSPEQALTAFDGELVSGTWTLDVFDDAASNVGTLDRWALLMTVPGPAEPTLPGVTVYVDQDRNGVLNTVSVQGDAGVPAAIPDGGNVESTITIADVGGPVADVEVYLGITHPSVGDLIADLISPQGTRVRLVELRGGGGDNFTDTVFDDEAANAIEDATEQDAPFTGWWRPETPLADFDGEGPLGDWTLSVSDLYAGQSGTLNFWSLRLTVGDFVATTDADGQYEFKDLPPGLHEVRPVLTHQWRATLPEATGEAVVENFEGDLGRYVQREAGQASVLSAAAAYEGSMGLVPGRWLVGGPESPIIGRGDTVSVHLRFPQAAYGGWAWLGIGVWDGGALAIGVSPGIAGGTPGGLAIWQWVGGLDATDFKTHELGQAELGHLASDVWYRLDVDWGLDGTVVARLYNAASDPSGATEVAVVAPWPVRQGALAFRGKLNPADLSEFYFDRISVRRGGAHKTLAASGRVLDLNFGGAADGIISGREFQDSNGNGLPDEGRGLPGWRVYDDFNQNGLFEGPVAETFGDTRHWGIDDRQTTVPWFEVAGLEGVIRDVNVIVDIEHYAVGDLTAWLVSPQGTRVELFSKVGGSGDHFPLTTFDDGAATPITSATWPLGLGATYRPEGRLADFNSEDPNGVWRLVVTDDTANGNEGTAKAVLVTLITGELEALTDVNGFYLGGELPARTYYLRQEPQAGWVQTAPQEAGWRQVAPRSGQIVLGQDFGNTRPGTVAGTVWHDHDSDGTRDLGDEDVPGQGVFLDVGDDGARDTYAGLVFAQPDDRAIPDLDVVTSMLSVSGLPGAILDVDVRLDIQHTYDTDLDVYLHSPQGTRVRLLEDVGGAGDNFTNTVLDDQAGASIASGSAPFTGSYQPLDPLAVLNGQDPNGVWLLEIIDDAGQDAGTLLEWQLTLSVGDPAATTDAGGSYQFTGVLPDDWSVRLEPRDEWFWVNPADGQQNAVVLIEDDVTGVDFTVNLSEPPTDVALSPSAVAENQPAGTTVGMLSTTDPDVGDTFTYSLVGGAGGTDNASFTITGVALETAASFNYEAKNTYNVRVRSTDQRGLWMEKPLAISVTNVNDVPAAEAGSNQEVFDMDGDWSEPVSLDGSASSDEEGLVSYVWRENGVEIATGVGPTVDLLVGGHTIELIVTDTDGATARDETEVFVAPLLGALPLVLIKPVQTDELSVGQTYALEWYGGDAQASVRMWCFSPTGLHVFADGLVGSQGGCDWPSAGSAPGWHCFIAQIQRQGQTFFSISPTWLKVLPAGGQPTGAQTIAVSPQTARVEDVFAPASVTWVTPTSQAKAVQGQILELNWEIHLPSAPPAAVDLLVSSRVDPEWRRLAERVEAQTRSYPWDTSDYEPGEYRFGIRLHDGGNGSAMVPSAWIELLPPEIGRIVA